MTHMRGWGLLLAIGMPLLILFSWNRLTAETTRINVERYGEWVSNDGGRFLQPLVDFYAKNRRVARPGEAGLSAFPKTSGVKSWSIQPDTVLHVELDGKDEGEPVVLRYVPMVKGPKGVFYDCVSASKRLVGRFCRADDIGSEAAIPAQLAANDRAVEQFASLDAASGAPAPPSSSGRVLAVPSDVAGLDACGYQCVQPQACINPRPLACGKLVTEGNTGRFELTPTPADHRGSGFATLAEADAACERAAGPGARVLRAASISGVAAKLRGGFEYWVHDDLEPMANCWAVPSR